MSADVLAKLCLKSLPLTFLIFSNVHSQEIITITADRIKSDLNKSPNDVFVLNENQILKSGSTNFNELFSSQSDLILTSSGVNGSTSSLFLRGTDSSHTLVVVDGISMNDPGNPNRLFDFSKLSLNNIEKIEILKGSQGLAYGSNAIGGVIVITTKKAKRNSHQSSTFAEVGSFRTVNTGFNLQHGFEWANLSIAADFFSTQGFSAANANVNPNAEKDGAQRVNFQLSVNRDFSDGLKVDSQIRYVQQTSDLDKGGGAGSDDPNDQLREEELYSKIEVSKIWEKQQSESTFSLTNSHHHRIFDEVWDPHHPISNWFKSTGEINTLNLNHTHYIGENVTQNLNLEFYEESDQSQNSNQNLSLFAYHQYEKEDSLINFGLRLDENKIFKESYTYKLALGHHLANSLLKFSASTGFRAPSLNQLFDPQYGNSKLTPERSETFDLGLDYSLSNMFNSTSTLFATFIKNRFSYDPVTFINRNAGEAQILGIEEKIGFSWSTYLHQSLALTLLKTKDLSTKEKLARRPDINIKNQIEYKMTDHHIASLESTFCGNRTDIDNNGNSVRMNNYFIHDLNYRFEYNRDTSAYLKIKNIFNTDYEQLYGYATGGRSFSVGTQLHY